MRYSWRMGASSTRAAFLLFNSLDFENGVVARDWHYPVWAHRYPIAVFISHSFTFPATLSA